MTAVEKIDARIIELENELKEVKGTEAEVYTRIVGYYRAVKNWNKGKREEYNHRVCFSEFNYQDNNISESAQEESETENNNRINFSDAVKYSYFFRKTCPNCPSVKGYVETLDLEGNHIDVDTEKGLETASDSQVFGVPTVVFYDNNNKEIFRAHNLKDLKENINSEIAFAV
eukprot:Anaeramoba_ignava/a349253_9.p2 GENE.a349253_9~~a349253_9.p2  ORF type:complete len:172 (+),score=35.87 a349253_9:1273-1788(+)